MSIAVPIATTTTNATTAITAATVQDGIATTSTTAAIAVNVWRTAVSARNVNSARSAVSARTDAVGAENTAKPSARTVARNVQDAHGYAIAAKNVWTAWGMSCIAPYAISALTARSGSATAAKDARSVHLAARIATKNVQNAHRTSFALPV